jgi:glycosyltransferase involved in cell wall biosynthesis
MDAENGIEVTVVMPCLNEEETVVGCIEEILDTFSKHSINGEVLVADNGSTDKSKVLAIAAGARVVTINAKGYGNALKGGIDQAYGKYVIMGDADGSYDFTAIPRFLTLLREGKELVMGCRLPRGGGTIEKGAMPWKHRWIGNPVLSFIGRLFFKTSIDDFHCGLRGFNRESILSLGLETGGMEFASEMVVKASLQNIKTAQVPVTLRPDKRSGQPHLRSWRDGWRHLRFMLLYSPGWLFVVPGVFMALLGVLGFVLLMPGPLEVNGINFDLNSLMASSAALIIGYQTLIMAAFVKTYSVNRGLLPGPKPFLVKAIEGRATEYGLVVGLLLVLLGVFGFSWMFSVWGAADYGDLPVQTSLRTTILSYTTIVIGVQTAFSGFVLSVLDTENQK